MESSVEMLNVYTDGGERIGVKSRSQVHADGDWHEVAFVLAARTDELSGNRFLLQLRSGEGDRYAGQADVFVGGHVSASEDHLEGAVRESTEETGIDLVPEDLLYLGGRFLENPEGVCRRVIQHFYLCLRPLTLADVAPTDEVSGFMEVGIGEFIELLEGKRNAIDASARLSAASSEQVPFSLTAAMFSKYNEPIMDSFRRSTKAALFALKSGVPDMSIWEKDFGKEL